MKAGDMDQMLTQRHAVLLSGSLERESGTRKVVLPVELLVLVVGDVFLVLRPQGSHRVAHLPVDLWRRQTKAAGGVEGEKGEV